MLSILCVTKGESYARPFIQDMLRLAYSIGAEVVLAADGPTAMCNLRAWNTSARLVRVDSKGYIESVLDEAVDACRGVYILRLDDDERCSPAMEKWLDEVQYTQDVHWKFPRAHFWKDLRTCIINPPLWPDHQTRLSVKEMSGGRRTVHAGSPFGGGRLAPVVLEHHKFLIKSYEERLAIAKVYDSVHPGYGTGGMRPFSLPEDVYRQEELHLVTPHHCDFLARTDASA